MENILHLTSYPPQRCGIAQYSKKLIDALGQITPSPGNYVIAFNGEIPRTDYGPRVIHQLDKEAPEQYLETVKAIKDYLPEDFFRVAQLQFENGLYGSHGQNIIPFLQGLKELGIPIVTTPHTVESYQRNEPDNNRRREVLQRVASLSDRLLVISPTARKRLIDMYVDPKKIDTMWHGASALNETKQESKSRLAQVIDQKFLNSLEGKTVLITAGFIVPNKGHELVLEAMPYLNSDGVVYVVAGDENKNPEYVTELRQKIEQAGLEDKVSIMGEFLPDVSDMLRLVNISDIIVIPYQSRQQISSGPLTSEVMLEKPIISTPFPYAKDILGEGRGRILGSYDDPQEMATAINELVSNPKLRNRISSKINGFKRKLSWPYVAYKHLDSYRRASQVNTEELIAVA